MLAALLAFHAVRIYQLAALRLTDIRDGRLHVGDQVIPLANPVRQRIASYLDYRQQTWPTAVNPCASAATPRPPRPGGACGRKGRTPAATRCPGPAGWRLLGPPDQDLQPPDTAVWLRPAR
ncbi:MAG TPA: hypothetical protein VKD26_03395 [Streptosporangiaceae bacterium]|nr:hypothetical protein [Streptosporangiaceae bacterium]